MAAYLFRYSSVSILIQIHAYAHCLSRTGLDKVATMLLGRSLNSLQDSQEILKVAGRRIGSLRGEFDIE